MTHTDIPEDIKQIIGNEGANRFPFQEYIKTEGTRMMKSDKGVFMDGAEFGYLLAESKIKELEEGIRVGQEMYNESETRAKKLEERIAYWESYYPQKQKEGK